jgi:hypothetical protein
LPIVPIPERLFQSKLVRMRTQLGERLASMMLSIMRKRAT